jgi:hypothetical protein
MWKELVMASLEDLSWDLCGRAGEVQETCVEGQEKYRKL